jgi:hypothetical protein
MPQAITVTMTLSPKSRENLERLGSKDIKPALRKALIAGTSPAVSEVRKAARNLESKSKKRTKESLRSQLAAAVQRKIGLSRRGVYVLIKSVPMGGLSNLARAIEGEIPLMHPTFGHKPDVTQSPKPYFYKTLEKIIPGVDIQVKKAFIKFEKEI